MICSTPAFVLKTFDFRETSKIAVFYSKELGKFKGLLKGIRRDPKKFSSILSPLSFNHVIVYKKRASDLHLVSQCDLLDDFGLTRPDLKSFGFSCHIAELVDLLMPLEDANHQVFDLMTLFLKTLNDSRQDTRFVFQIKILALSGFKPHLDSCLSCEVKILKDAYFSYAKGGLLCARCLFQDKNAEPILQGAISTILYVEKCTWQNCLRISMLSSVKNQLERILDCFVRFHAGKALKTNRLVHDFLDL